MEESNRPWGKYTVIKDENAVESEEKKDIEENSSKDS